jgi:hypothetical protein
MAIDASAVVAQFGAHYIDQGQSLNNVKKLLYAMYKTGALFQDRPQTGDYFRSTNAMMSSVLQPFQKAFTSKGNLTFKPNAFPLFQFKIDQSIFPDDIVSSYLGFLGNVADNERANWPLIRYIIEVHIMDAKGNDMEKLISFGGKYVAPTAGTAGAAQTTADGVKEVLKRYNTAGRLNMGNGPLSMGALSSDPVTFCAQVEAWVQSMMPELRAQLDKIVMSETLAKRYAKGKRLTYGKDINFLNGGTVNDLLTIEDYNWISVDGYISHEGSSIIWATPKVNRIRPIWKSTLQNVFKVESYKREVSIYTDWWEALDFEVPELVIVNDSADLA